MREIGSRLQSRNPMMIASLARPGRLRANCGVDKGKDFGLVQPLQAHVLVDVPRAGVEVLGKVAGASDGAQAEGGGRQALGGSVFGEGVEEGGGGAVGGLAVVAEEGGEGAEHEEEVEVGEEVMKVPGA